MDIYSIGEEKCVDGVWGRELAGRFYTHVHGNREICRHLSVNQNEFKYEYYAVLTDKTTFCEQVYTQKTLAIKQYIPQHIKDLENLRRGAIVWVFIEGSWKTVTFWHRTAADITCVLEFSYSGLTYPHSYIVVDEVVIERPFTI